jgi:SynChlorMet cassette radical SAM/SPASM protein ScmE
MKIMKMPRSVNLDITNRCNLRCSYCSHFGSPGDVGQDLAAGEWLKFFAELGDCAVMRVCLSGGEPFIREDLELLLEGIVKNRMRYSILTNGTMITGNRAAYLAQTGRCDGVQLSIDGAGPRSHDSCRGGSFDRVLRGLEILRRWGLPVAVRVTLHRHNVHELEEIARLLLEELGLPAFSTNAASPMGLCLQNGDKVQLDSKQRQYAMDTLVRLERRYPGRIQAAAGPLAEARIWQEMEQARGRGLKYRQGCGYLSACGGVLNKIAVRADGVMVPCTHLSHIELGRINQDGLLAVWQDHPELNRMRQRRQVPLSDFPFCRGCEYLPYCRGGCPGHAYGVNRDENRPAADSCYRRFLDQGGRLPLDDNEI